MGEESPFASLQKVSSGGKSGPLWGRHASSLSATHEKVLSLEAISCSLVGGET